VAANAPVDMARTAEATNVLSAFMMNSFE